jgi:hypothetical protein
MEDEFDFLRAAEAENDALRFLLQQVQTWCKNTGVLPPRLEDAVKEAVEKKAVKSAYRLGVEEAIRHLRQCEQAETEAHYEYRHKDHDPEAKVAHEMGRSYGIAVSELEKWLGG